MAKIITVDGVKVWDDDYARAKAKTGSSSGAIDLLKSYGTTERGAWGAGPGDEAISSGGAAIAKEEARAESRQDMEDLFRLSAEYGRQQVLQAEESATRMIERNIDRFPEISKLALDTSSGAATQINALMRTEYESALDELYPEWRTDIVGAATTAQKGAIDITKRFQEKVLPGLMDRADEISGKALSQVSSMLSGELPDDVAAQLKRHAAEVSQQIGVRGQAAQYLTARDLGRTSLDLIQAGMAAAPGALNLAPAAYGTYASTLQTPVATGQQVTNALAPYRAPITDISALYGGQLNVLAGVGTVSPTSALSTAAQVGVSAGGQVQNQLQFGTQYSSQQYWNSINHTAQQRAAEEAAGGGSNALGSLIGGAAGAATAFIPGVGPAIAPSMAALGAQFGGSL